MLLNASLFEMYDSVRVDFYAICTRCFATIRSSIISSSCRVPRCSPCSRKVSSLFPGPEAAAKWYKIVCQLLVRLEHFTVVRFAYFHHSTPHVRLVLLHKRFAQVFDLSTIFKLIEPTVFLLLSRSILPILRCSLLRGAKVPDSRKPPSPTAGTF